MDNTQIGVRVTEDQKKRIERVAEAEYRSVSKLTRMLLMQYVERREKQEEGHKQPARLA